MASADFRVSRPIVLVGLMGAGKSTVGPRVAERLGLPFDDLDAEMERVTGRHIADLFEALGERGFREAEREALARLLDGSARVIAAGGGAIVDPDSRERLRETCTVVWLDAPVATLARRIGADSARPLLRGRATEIVLGELAEQRRPFHDQAHLRIDAEGDVETVAARVIAALGALD